MSLPPLRSLKRKRDEDEDTEGESEGESEQGDSPPPATEPRKRGRPRKERKSLFLLSLFHFLTVLFVLEPRQLPSRQVRDKKRLRKSCSLFYIYYSRPLTFGFYSSSSSAIRFF